MDEQTRRVLADAGWSLDRRVDAGPGLLALAEAGCDVWPGLTPVPESLTGLRVAIDCHGRRDEFWFDPEKAIEESFWSWVEEYSRRADKPLAPIGYGHHDHLMLLVDPEGVWYGGYDDEFGIIGADGEAMLNALVSGSTTLAPVPGPTNTA